MKGNSLNCFRNFQKTVSKAKSILIWDVFIVHTSMQQYIIMRPCVQRTQTGQKNEFLLLVHPRLSLSHHPRLLIPLHQRGCSAFRPRPQPFLAPRWSRPHAPQGDCPIPGRKHHLRWRQPHSPQGVARGNAVSSPGGDGLMLPRAHNPIPGRKHRLQQRQLYLCWRRPHAPQGVIGKQPHRQIPWRQRRRRPCPASQEVINGLHTHRHVGLTITTGSICCRKGASIKTISAQLSPQMLSFYVQQ